MTGQDTPFSAFLTVQEAAERLGVSRLRVREAVARGLLASRRDNEGRLRIDLPEDLKLGALRKADLAPDAVVAFLFDDIEELEAALAERDAQIATLSDLLERQDGALARADAAFDISEAQSERLSALLAQALDHLEAGDTRQRHLTGVSERALGALKHALERAEAGDAQATRMAGLLDRAMELAQQGQDTQGVADRALGLLEAALLRAETAQGAAVRAEQSEARVRTVLQAREADLAARETALESSLRLSERATALAEKQDKPRRKGFLRWLFGV